MNVHELMQRTTIAAPCPVKWEEMTGDDKIRLCAKCDLNVYSAQAMTDEEVLRAIESAMTGQKVCMQFYRRVDGTFITKNCPKGLQLLRERARRVASMFAGALSLLLSTASGAAPKCDTAGDAAGSGDKKPTWHSTVRKDGSGVNTGASKVGETAGAKQAPPMLGGAIAVMPSSDEDVKRECKKIEALKVEKGSDSLEVARALRALGYTYSVRQEHKQALAVSVEALDIFEAKKEYGQARDCANFAVSMCTSLRDEKKAQEFKSKAFEYQRRLRDKNNE